MAKKDGLSELCDLLIQSNLSSKEQGLSDSSILAMLKGIFSSKNVNDVKQVLNDYFDL